MEFVAAELRNRARYARIIQIIQQLPIWPCFIRTLTRYSEPGQPRPHTEQTAHVQNRRFTFEQGTAPDREHPQPRAHQGARQSPITGNIPKRRPPRPQQPISDTCRRGSLHFGRLNTRAGLHTEEMGL